MAIVVVVVLEGEDKTVSNIVMVFFQDLVDRNAKADKTNAVFSA